MSKNHFNTAISPNNKLNKFMSFTKDDMVLRDFIDYLTFYTTWDNKPLLKFINRDNGPSFYLGRLSLDIAKNRIGHFLWQIHTVYNGHSVAICQLKEIKVWSKLVIKVSIYWKWLKLLREDFDLYKTLKCLFTDRLMFWEELTVCRIDYTCDCAKYNFRKYNSMRAKKGADFKNKEWESMQVKTVYFWKRSHDSAYFIRYYDKKYEIQHGENGHNTEWLYPEYQFIPEVMRYELSVNSKWLDKKERDININNLYDLITLWYDIPFRNRKDEKYHWKDETVLNTAIKNVNLLKNIGDYESIDKLYIYLNELYVNKGRSLPFTSDEYNWIEEIVDQF